MQVDLFSVYVMHCSIMFVDFKDLVEDTEKVATEVFRFVDVDPQLYRHKPIKPGVSSWTLVSSY